MPVHHVNPHPRPVVPPKGPPPPTGTTPAGPGPGKGGAAQIVRQPAFDPRIHSLSSPFGSNSGSIFRGVMFWDPGVPWAAPIGSGGAGIGGQTTANAPAIQFLYNPSTVAASYAIDNVGQQSALIYPAAQISTNLIVPLQQTLSFTLMFDRTYEVNTEILNKGNLAQAYGCEIDVLAMKQFTGMFSTIVSATGGTSAQNPFSTNKATNASITDTNTVTLQDAISGTVITQGVMTVALSYIYFSGQGGADIGLKYYGYVSGWDVQYTHFSQRMIPMRCVIDVSFTLMPPPSKATTGGTGKNKGGATSVNTPTFTGAGVPVNGGPANQHAPTPNLLDLLNGIPAGGLG